MVESAQNSSTSFKIPFLQKEAASADRPAKGAFEQKSVSELPPVPLLAARKANEASANPLPRPAIPVEALNADSMATYAPAEICSEVQNGNVGRKKKPVGGVQFDENSQISAQAMLCMIKENKKLTPLMKDFFVAQGDSLGLNPARVQKTKSGQLLISMKPGEPKVDDLPIWFKNALVAIGSGKWQFTTGLSITSKEPSTRFITDGPLPSPLPDGDKVIGYGFTSPRKEMPLTSKNEIIVVPEYVSVANRFKYTLTEGKEVAVPKIEIVATFFHEFASHAALIHEGRDPIHTSDDYRLDLKPMSEADNIARDVDLFFELIDKVGRVRGEGLEAGYQIERANVSGLVKSVNVVTDLDHVPQLDRNNIERTIKSLNNIGNLKD